MRIYFNLFLSEVMITFFAFILSLKINLILFCFPLIWISNKSVSSSKRLWRSNSSFYKPNEPASSFALSMISLIKDNINSEDVLIFFKFFNDDFSWVSRIINETIASIELRGVLSSCVTLASINLWSFLNAHLWAFWNTSVMSIKVQIFVFLEVKSYLLFTLKCFICLLISALK